MEADNDSDAIEADQETGSVEQDGDAQDAATGLSVMAEGDGTIVEEGETLHEGEHPQVARPRSFAETLVEAGMLSETAAERAQLAARREGLPLSRVLVRDGLVLSRDLAAFTALHLGLTMVDLRSETLEPEIVGLLSEDIARRYTVLALRKTNGTLTVAMADPTDLQTIQDLTARTGYSIEPEVASDQELQEHIDIAYRMVKTEDTGEGTEITGGRVTASSLAAAPPAQVIDLLLVQASHDGASDIHVEPQEERLRIRFRIDGVLQETMTLPKDLHPTLLSRIKIMSNMNIAERRRPQDGQLSFEDGDRKIDVRAAVCNTVYGEMAVLRAERNHNGRPGGERAPQRQPVPGPRGGWCYLRRVASQHLAARPGRGTGGRDS